MQQISSLKNDRVRRVCALQRSTRRRFREMLMVVEGARLMQEAIRSRLPIVETFYTEIYAASAEGQVMIAALMQRAIPVWGVPEDVMAAMSDTDTPQGILGVLPIPQPVETVDYIPSFILIPDGIRDPGNLGTLLRTAWATGVSSVLLPPGTVDFTNPKVVRAGMGAHFYVPLFQATWDEIADRVTEVDIWIAEAGQGTAYSAVNWQRPVALIIGGEAEGAGDEARSLPGARYVYIPMAPGVDSLNAAIAAAVLMFEAARVRAI
ncbi:MAG: RNA methyltransferase [Anaerolineae bacterium]|nr:RNA methyltransferase [Anaerolineae bacterium]